MARWRLTLLGGLEARSGESDLVVTRFRTQKAAALLAHLALAPRPQPRETLLALLWPDTAPEAARNSLSVALSSLRHTLESPGNAGGSVLVADRQTIGLSPGAVETDVALFLRAEQATRPANLSPAVRLERQQHALRLYAGPLLPGFYDDAVLVERERLGELFFRLARAVALVLADEAVAVLHRARQLDPDRAELYAELLADRGRTWEARALPSAPVAAPVLRTRVRIGGVDSGRTGVADALRQHAGEELAPGTFAFAEARAALLFAQAMQRRGAEGIAIQTREQPEDEDDWHERVRPGRIVCGEASAALVRRHLPAGVVLVEAGRWQRPGQPSEPLYELRERDAAESTEPALHGLSPERTRNLPAYPTRFFGRQAELQQLKERLEEGRLVTILGLGGFGKTRLVVEALRGLADEGRSVWFVSLADLTDGASLTGVLRVALGLPAGGSEWERVVAVLAEQPSVLVLDNVEQLLDTVVPFLTPLLETVASLRIITTSRRALNVPGERLLPLAPLPVAAEEAEPAVLLRASPAVALFCDRARTVLPDFTLTPRNATAVSALCRRLDGIPLALELAASRARVLTPGQWLERLEAGLDVVATSTRAGVPERHRTLTATLRWSCALLPPETRAFLGALTVFRGGWSLEAAEAVTDDPLTLDHLAILAENALIGSEEGPEGLRFTLLEVVREFAATLDPDTARWEARHGQYFAALAAQAGSALSGPDSARWLNRLEQEHENLRAALDRQEDSLALAAQLARFWEIHGHFTEGRRRLAHALACRAASGQDRATALSAAGVLAMCQADYPAAQAHFEEELALRRLAGAPLDIARCLHKLSGVWLRWAHYDTAEGLLEESLALKRAHAAPPEELATALINLGVIANERGHWDLGIARLSEALAAARAVGSTSLIAMALNNLGIARQETQDLDGAYACFVESLALKETQGDRRGAAITLQNIATILRERGEYGAARAHLERSLALLRALGDPASASLTLFGLGTLASVGEERHQEAARLWGAFMAIRDQLGIGIPPAYRTACEERFALARRACGDDVAWQAAWDEGYRTDWRTLAETLLSSNK